MEFVDKLNAVKNCIPYAVDEDEETYGLYFLSCYGLLSKFGDEYLELIEKVFEECKFFVDERPLELLIRETGYSHKVVPGEKACSFPGVCAGIDNQLNLVIYEENPMVCMSTTDCTPNEQLIMLTHEISHIFKSMIRSVIKDEKKNTITIRRGLLLETFNADDRDLNATYSNWVLDEAINVFQTADMMKSICEIDREFLDDNVRAFFDTLDLGSLAIPSGYQAATHEVSLLWKNEHFKNSIDYNVVSGDIESIEDDFDSIMGTDKFREFSEALDFSFFNDGISFKKIKSVRTIMNTVFNYNRKTNKKGTEKIKS